MASARRNPLADLSNGPNHLGVVAHTAALSGATGVA